MKKTPLYDEHIKLNAKMVDFAGYSMPVRYDSIVNEHNCVRENVGLFDISHMGQILISGPSAFLFMQDLIANNMDKLFDGKVLYTPLCNNDGGVVDDILVYQKSKGSFLLVVNASNKDKVYNWLIENKADKYNNIIIDNLSENFSMLALQGPNASKLLERVGFHISDLKYYTFKSFQYSGSEIILSRTGYTGENGYEIFVQPSVIVELWNQLLKYGKEYGIKPIGLGARDTLRMEVGFCLYGHELNDNISPLEADIGWAVDLKKNNFIGLAALKEKTLMRKLVGIEMLERGIPREGYKVFIDNKEIGFITSGSYMPYLKKNMGLALIKKEYAMINQEVKIEIRGKRTNAKITAKPFYIPFSKRKKIS